MPPEDVADITRLDIMSAAHRSEAILVVEDEPFIALDIDEVLKVAGLTAEIRSSRSDAMRWLERKSPAAAVLDLHLRDGDGLAIALILQSRGIPIIFCSGGDPSELPIDFRLAAWVSKPFVAGELVAAVRLAINPRGPHQQMEEGDLPRVNGP